MVHVLADVGASVLTQLESTHVSSLLQLLPTAPPQMGCVVVGGAGVLMWVVCTESVGVGVGHAAASHTNVPGLLHTQSRHPSLKL